MCNSYSAETVFQPKSYPTNTYVERLAGTSTYAKRMQRAIRTPGNLVVISGASKSGKTVLCHHVISEEKIIDLSGSQIQENDDFWEQIAENVAMPVEIQVTKQNSDAAKKGKSGGLKLSAGLSAGGSIHKEHTHTAVNSIMSKSLRTNAEMMKYLIQNGKVLVIDDFHYIPQAVQQYIARTLKTELFRGLKAVILTLPHRSDDAIRLNF